MRMHCCIAALVRFLKSSVEALSERAVFTKDSDYTQKF